MTSTHLAPGDVRDQFASREQLESLLASCDRGLRAAPEVEAVAKANSEDPSRYDAVVVGTFTQYWLRRLFLLYSVGVPVGELRGEFGVVVARAPFEQWRRRCGGAFVDVLLLASWARLLGDGQSCERLRVEVGLLGFGDSLLDVVLSDAGVGGGVLDVPVRSELDPVVYLSLVEAARFAVEGDGVAAAERFERYVRGEWYRSFQWAGWWGTHKKMRAYRGYWAFEAAAVANVFGIDDRGLRGSRYYPWDLAHLDDPVSEPEPEPEPEPEREVVGGVAGGLLVEVPGWVPVGFGVCGAHDPAQDWLVEEHALLCLVTPSGHEVEVEWGSESVVGRDLADGGGDGVVVEIAGRRVVAFEGSGGPGFWWSHGGGVATEIGSSAGTPVSEVRVVAEHVMGITQGEFIEFAQAYAIASLPDPDTTV